MTDEMIDIYDASGVKTGEVIPRKGAFLKEGQFMLYVLAIIQDECGRFLITRRALDKKWAAGVWEVPGGGVCAGEDSVAGVAREVLEETGLDVRGKAGAPVYSYENVDLARGDNYIVDIYRIQLDFDAADVVLQEREAIGFKLATWDEITQLEEQDSFLHYARIKEALARSEAKSAANRSRA